ncbi:MAG: hypothetical protein JWP74_1818 [Marmoricola sp.]|nr:hypothetical protein [Marmoricola sp.]
MSKMDDMRAMREARYEAARSTASKPSAAPKPRPAPDRAARAETVSEPVADGLCGHRAISGRTCTRDKGHEAKSHRYS